MQIKQFEDKGLSHFSYAILSETENEIILIDPARDPSPYYQYAQKMGSKIIGVIETHPHADFVSSHLEIHKSTGAKIYVSEKVGALYPHSGFDEGQVLKIGEIELRALNTPGHSPDSICIVAAVNGIDQAVFTGDTLFIGDVGRPDLREKAGTMKAKREELARQMYHSVNEKLFTLEDHVKVYPAHGSGSLCGKALSDASSSTIMAEKRNNAAMQFESEEEFISELLSDQPFIPKYFGYNVDLNKQGAPDYEDAISKVLHLDENFQPEEGALIIDTRKEQSFKRSHFKGAINLMDGGSFETWLGSIIAPSEAYYLIAESKSALDTMIAKASKIGYDMNLKGVFVYSRKEDEHSPILDTEDFKSNPENYTIVDIRNQSEWKEGKLFEKALHFPLHDLRDDANDLPSDKPVVVHCAGGYRSTAGASILESKLKGQKVYDLSTAIEEFK